jgi:hypothetical protein
MNTEMIQLDQDSRLHHGFGHFGGFGHGFGHFGVFGRPGFGFGGFGRPFGFGFGLPFLGGLAAGALLSPWYGYGYGYGYPYYGYPYYSYPYW